MIKTHKMVSVFIQSAGVLLLACATVLLISYRAGAGLVHTREPLLLLPLPTLFWLVGGIQAVVALICLFGKKTSLQLDLLLWLMVNFLVYRIGLVSMGDAGGFQGYLGDVTEAFGISCGTANALLNAMAFYLLAGSALWLSWLWVAKPSPAIRGEVRTTPHGRPAVAPDFLKMSCPECGVHIRFDDRNLGQKISCPQCRKSITLRKPDLLKISCFFCKEHIEFPPHSIGEKISCPHCKMDITLKEPT